MNTYFASRSNRPMHKEDNDDGTTLNVDFQSVSNMIQLGLLMSIEGQLEPLPFESVFTPRRIEKLVKVGVGGYSEVFGFTDEDVVMKVTPFGGDIPFHERPQSKISEMFTEVTATKAISELESNHDSGCRTDNFAHLISVTVLKGILPSYLIKAKRKSDDFIPVAFVEENKFPNDQLWTAFEFSYAGESVINYWPRCARARLSILAQAALALAVAEKRIGMEHRDLHLGNVLISPTAIQGVQACLLSPPPSYIDGVRYQPSEGPAVCIIDFACARLQHKGSTLFVDMTDRCKRLKNKNDAVAQIYNIMQDLLGGKWCSYNPKTNIYWLSFLALWLLDPCKGQDCEVHSNVDVDKIKETVMGLLLRCDSAYDFVLNAKKCTDFLFK
ncbi:hypothetical protein Aperf_G00000004763 [Anoplocephala perfoliata]